VTGTYERVYRLLTNVENTDLGSILSAGHLNRVSPVNKETNNGITFPKSYQRERLIQ